MPRFRYTSVFATWREFCDMRHDIASDCLLSVAPGVYGHVRESLLIVINEEATR